MFWLLVKSDIKRICRDRGHLIMMLVMPVLFILILSSAFGSLMDNKFELSPFSVGYTISEKSPIYSNFDKIKKELSSNKITLVSITKDKALTQISTDKLAGFVEFTDTGYKFYKNENLNIDAGIFESVLQSISYSTGTYTEMYKVLAALKINPGAQAEAATGSLFTVKKLETKPWPSALTYYGIVMIIQMVCFSTISAPVIINTDRKTMANRRIALSKVSPFTVFTARAASSVISGFMQILISILASVIILKVDYGAHWPIIVGIMLLFSAAISSVGVFLGYLLSNLALTRTLVYGISFALNFFGGSYMQYLYVTGSLLAIMKKTPLYYVNRSLVEIASQGSSNVLPIALTIIISTLIVSVILGAFVYSKKEGKLCAN